jgi:hypothetical protein
VIEHAAVRQRCPRNAASLKSSTPIAGLNIPTKRKGSEIHQLSESVGSTVSAPTPAVNMASPRFLVLLLTLAISLAAGNITEDVAPIVTKNIGSSYGVGATNSKGTRETCECCSTATLLTKTEKREADRETPNAQHRYDAHTAEK